MRRPTATTINQEVLSNLPPGKTPLFREGIRQVKRTERRDSRTGRTKKVIPPRKKITPGDTIGIASEGI
jgi:hypothetical protein